MTASGGTGSGLDEHPVEVAAHEGRGRPLRPLHELGFVAAGFGCYLLVRWSTLGRTDEAMENAGEVLGLEERLGLDWEHSIQSTTYAVAPWIGHAATHFYVWAYFPVLVAVALWLYARRPDAYRTLRTALLASGVVGLAVYALYPCAPPWMSDDRFRDTVSHASLDAFARPGGIMNEVGAMPSFHVAWLTLAAVVVLSVSRVGIVRALCVAVPLVMFFAVVATGNHWLLDIPAGLALAAWGLLVATRGRAARHHEPPGGDG
jgi:hypothetical protein